MSLTVKNLKEGFEDFNVELEDWQAKKLLELVEYHSYESADDVVNEWLAYWSSHKCNFTLEKFEAHLKEVNERKNKKKLKLSSNTPLKQKSTNSDSSNDILSSYLSPDLKRKITSSVTPQWKSETPIKSPFPDRHSEKYSIRQNAGEQVQVLADDQSEDPLKIVWPKSIPKQYKATAVDVAPKKETYMFQKVLDISNCMNDCIEDIADSIQSQNAAAIDSYLPCTESSQTQMCVVGRVATEAGCRLAGDTLWLEGDRNYSGGRGVSVDVSKMARGSLFRGQIVAFKGVNPTGKKFIASEMFTLRASEGRLKMAAPSVINNSNAKVSVMVAAGPFTTSDAMSYEPLADFIKLVAAHKPDTTLLIGPLLDEQHANINELEDTFSYVSRKWLTYLTEELTPHTHLVFIPSQRDVFHHPVYPQPPYEKSIAAKSLMAPDPFSFTVGPIGFGATSVDSLMHMGANEMSCMGQDQGPRTDRRVRLMQHLIDQQHFYPLYPAHDSLCVDWMRADLYARMSTPPEVLIVPSDLRSFVKLHHGRLFVNPGRLSKGAAGGTYAHVLLDVSDADDVNGDHVIGCVARIVKI